MTEYFGTFKERGCLRPGALYARKFKFRRPDSGQVAFKAGIPRQRVPDAHYATTRTGDPYGAAAHPRCESQPQLNPLSGAVRAPERVRQPPRGAGGRREGEEGEAAPAAPAPFKPASPMKRSAPQAGDTAGTFQGRVPYEPPYTPEAGGKREVRHAPRGIYTSPAKRGGYGFNKTTLSERRGHKGVMGEFEHLAEPIREAVRAAAPEGGRTPFKCGGGAQRGAFSRPAYVPQGVPEKPERRPIAVPFRPTFAGATLRFGSPPEHMLDPPPEPTRQKGPEYRAWRTPKREVSDYFRSIVRMNV